jgi:hypothetical protein
MIDALDITLSSNSPAKNAGIDVCSTITTAYDLDDHQVCADGVFTGKGSAPDIGPYEYWPTGGRPLVRINGRWWR